MMALCFTMQVPLDAISIGVLYYAFSKITADFKSQKMDVNHTMMWLHLISYVFSTVSILLFIFTTFSDSKQVLTWLSIIVCVITTIS
jgi:hypothetical protein